MKTFPSLPSPSDFFLKGLRQQGLSLTFGIFVGAALTSGAVFGATAVLLANERLLRQVRQNITGLALAARDVALKAATDLQSARFEVRPVFQTVLEPPHGNALQKDLEPKFLKTATTTRTTATKTSTTTTTTTMTTTTMMTTPTTTT